MMQPPQSPVVTRTSATVTHELTFGEFFFFFLTSWRVIYNFYITIDFRRAQRARDVILVCAISILSWFWNLCESARASCALKVNSNHFYRYAWYYINYFERNFYFNIYKVKKKNEIIDELLIAFKILNS